MSQYRLTKAERETIIRWNDDDRVATCDTASPRFITIMDKLVEAYPEAFRCTHVDHPFGAKKYEFHSNRVSMKKPVSEARRQAAIRNVNARRHKGKNSPYFGAESGGIASPDESVMPL